MALEKTKTMFDDCAIEAPPTCIEDCTNQDKVTVNLWTWAHRLEVLGQVLLALIIIGGLFISFSNAYAISSALEGAGKFSAKIFFTSIISYVIYAIVEYCAYHVLALLVGSLARIVQSNRTMARLAELEARNKTINL